MSYQDEYELWLNSVTDAEKQELAALSEQEKKERFYAPLEFGTAGMRGILRLGCNGMNCYTVGRATVGLAEYIISNNKQGAGVALAYDTRYYSNDFARLTAGILAQNGIKVYMYQTVRPVPMLSFAVRRYNCFAGVMITASHNPSCYNGYKVYGQDGAQLSPEPASRMLDIIQSHSYFGIECMPFDKALQSGLVTLLGKGTDDAYINELLPLFKYFDKDNAGLKITYTPIHGSGYELVTRMLGELDVDFNVVQKQAVYDGGFSTVKSPNPENMEALTLAIEQAKAQDSDIVLGTDPDCDRVGVAVNKDGEFIPLTGNQTGCLMLYALLDTLKSNNALPGNGVVIKTVVTTELARAIAQSYGMQLVEVLTGFKFIGEKIKEYEQTGEHTYLFGFEESFGYLLGTHARDKDGVVACALIAKAAAKLKKQGKTLLDGLDDLYKKYGYYLEKTVPYTLEGIEGMEKIQSIMASMAKQPPKELAGNKVLALRNYLTGERKTCDGVTEKLTLPKSNVLYFEMQNGWACIRPSGTEPKIKLYLGVCGKSKAQAEQDCENILAALVKAAGL